MRFASQTLTSGASAAVSTLGYAALALLSATRQFRLMITLLFVGHVAFTAPLAARSSAP